MWACKIRHYKQMKVAIRVSMQTQSLTRDLVHILSSASWVTLKFATKSCPTTLPLTSYSMTRSSLFMTIPKTQNKGRVILLPSQWRARITKSSKPYWATNTMLRLHVAWTNMNTTSCRKTLSRATRLKQWCKTGQSRGKSLQPNTWSSLHPRQS